MANFDFKVPAGLYVYAGTSHGRRLQGLKFHRFPTLADAIKYAVEELDLAHQGVRIETDDRDLDADEIRRAYSQADFPLDRRS